MVVVGRFYQGSQNNEGRSASRAFRSAMRENRVDFICEEKKTTFMKYIPQIQWIGLSHLSGISSLQSTIKVGDWDMLFKWQFIWGWVFRHSVFYFSVFIRDFSLDLKCVLGLFLLPLFAAEGEGYLFY